MSKTEGPPITNVKAVDSLNNADYDALLLISAPAAHKNIPEFAGIVDDFLQIDPSLTNEIAIIPVPLLKAKRLIYVPTGAINSDYDDVRIFKDTALKGIKRAVKAGVKKPLLILQEHSLYKNSDLVTLLGVLEGLYTPIQVRENDPSKLQKVETLGVYSKDLKKTEELIKIATTLESGRRVACDIGDADPERMSPPNVEKYVTGLFKDSNVKVDVVSDLTKITKEYPLFEAVNRAARDVPRHQGRIIFLEYSPEDASKVEETLLFVGKGVTYDTGGADIKHGGWMAGMSRDKCGAAACLGFMQLIRLMQPKNLKVIMGVSMVRNSVGSNSYVSDELIKARSGAMVRIGNTDAEGRMVMADVLCRMKELALDAINPHLYTVATLTGHAVITVGQGYSIVLDNGPARKTGHAVDLQNKSEQIGDPFEISRLRKEDFAFHAGVAEGDDIIQANSKPSSQTCRGHQGPAAFLIMASGLDKNGSDSTKPLKYSHLDIAASGGDFPRPATGAPVLALANKYLL